MFACYSPSYYVDLGKGHPFPMEKYPRTLERLVREGTLPPSRVIRPSPLPDASLVAAHSSAYLHRVSRGLLSPQEVRRLGFPWSPPLLRRARCASGGTLIACHVALTEGIGVNLAGGSHHAFSDRGEGFCVFNDLAVAIRTLQRERRIHRAAVIDCDVHQGNGTAAMFQNDPDVLTFSIHGANNYPYRQVPSTTDIALPDGTQDDFYMQALQGHLPGLLRTFQPELVLYVAGVDPYRGDRLGRLKLTLKGLQQRDAFVLGLCREQRIPVVVTFAGGYAANLDDTVEAHCQTVRVARALL
ncbi:MAG: histone deacetylase [candidate division NC10 bacterium]|nr:histone deacetylase [candidate division NC10 bacterium]